MRGSSFRRFSLLGSFALGSRLSIAGVGAFTNKDNSNENSRPDFKPSLLNDPVRPNLFCPLIDKPESYFIYFFFLYVLFLYGVFHTKKKQTKKTKKEEQYEVLPPKAKKIPTITQLPWDTTVDNYRWMQDEKSEDTLSYLRAENAYTDYKMKHTEDFQKQLYDEMLNRIVEGFCVHFMCFYQKKNKIKK